MDYLQFERIMLNKQIGYIGGRPSQYAPGGYRWGLYRVSKKYRRKKDHKKKEKSQREEWREWSGINRDKAKANMWTRRWKRRLKKQSSRNHRMAERMAIASEDFDSLSRRSGKEAADPWSWD
jgi:hypothetical protein